MLEAAPMGSTPFRPCLAPFSLWSEPEAGLQAALPPFVGVPDQFWTSEVLKSHLGSAWKREKNGQIHLWDI